MEEVRFTYVVNPRRPIKGIQDMPPIRTSKTLKLTKEEALICMKCGPVYRRFANEDINERVSATNIDRLHNEKFITEKEYSGSNIPTIESKEEKKETIVVNNNTGNTPIIEEKIEKDDPKEVAQNVEAETVDTVENNTDTEDSTNESSDSEAKDNTENSEEINEVNDNQQEDKKNITVDYNNNRSRKKKKYRNNN